MRTRRRVCGASAWKLLLGVAAGIGAVWIFAQSALPRPEAGSGSRAVAGPIAMRTAVPDNGPRVAAAPAAPATPTQSDPFAGVDVSNDSVLRHIAGIDENARKRQQRAQPRGAAAAPAAPATTRPAAPSPVAPVRPEPAATQRPAANLPAAAIAIQPAPTLEPPRVSAVLQTSVTDAPVARSGTESAAASAPPVERQAVADAPPSTGDVDRTQLAALGNVPSKPLATTAPLRVIARPVPSFPIEAIRAGIHEGRVVARLTIEADGRVSGAQIVKAAPLGYFERESRRALANWRYEPPGRQTSADVELIFTRE